MLVPKSFLHPTENNKLKQVKRKRKYCFFQNLSLGAPYTGDVILLKGDNRQVCLLVQKGQKTSSVTQQMDCLSSKGDKRCFSHALQNSPSI